MIALLSYSTSWSKSNDNDTIPSTGVPDSVMIAIDDLKIVNSKLIELKYEKEKVENYQKIVSNDSIVISELTNEVIKVNEKYNRDTKALKKERNIVGCAGLGFFICLMISLF